ncbi:MAG: hypothetical protein LRY51_03210 [Geovibrio sp.]|nr:hypothetical protein [Geovibrio sp.]
MKKTMAVITLSFLAFACSDETQVIKQSINNIKDEMVSMQSEMAEMKISIEDVDRKTEANKGSINANSNALAEIRSELSFLGSEVTLLKDKQKAPAPRRCRNDRDFRAGRTGRGESYNNRRCLCRQKQPLQLCL